MIDPKKISIKDYTYHLPADRIAAYPLAERDASKLLIYKNGNISEDIYRNIAEYIPPGSLLVFNDTKVVEARLFFQKPSGGIIEIFCLEPHGGYPDITTAMSQHEKVLWHCLIGGASKWKHGQVLEKKIVHNGNEFILRVKYIEKLPDCFVVEISWNKQEWSFAEVLHLAGAVPLPPYIKREAESLDTERYQTIYAHYEGSVAAPTSGFHFTEAIFNKLKAKNIQTCFVTLHVGIGTFRPVKTETIAAHEMHAEIIRVPVQTIEMILANLNNNIIAVGTTSLRTMESLYWLGVKTIANSSKENYEPEVLHQWEASDLEKFQIPVKEALESLLQWLRKKGMDHFMAKTQLIIIPGYIPQIAKAVITNFHQPESTLLLLVASLIGEDWKKVYEYAMQNEFHFLSYGDGSLLWFK